GYFAFALHAALPISNPADDPRDRVSGPLGPHRLARCRRLSYGGDLRRRRWKRVASKVMLYADRVSAGRALGKELGHLRAGEPLEIGRAHVLTPVTCK